MPALSTQRCSLLVVDDEPYILPTLSALLAKDFEVITADRAEAAQAILSRREISILLTDQKMPGITGVELLAWARDHSPKTVRLLMTGYAELEDAVESINRGHVYYYLLKPWRSEELLQILRNAAEKFALERHREELLAQQQRLNQELERRVQERTQELERRTRELEKLAMTDSLTGLLNRRAIDNLAVRELKRHARYSSSPLAIGLIDADHFREINRLYLLTGGDEVLKGLSQILKNSIRHDVDLVGRIGGEEFLVLAPETNVEGAVVLAERIRSTVERSPITYEESAIHLTVSIGFGVAEAEIAAGYDQMKHVAAAALAESKTTGRNRAVVRALHKPSDAA